MTRTIAWQRLSDSDGFVFHGIRNTITTRDHTNMVGFLCIGGAKWKVIAGNW